MQFARVYASSANLPDGTMIIAGGIGKSGILKTAEIVGRNQDGSWYSRRVPQLMPRGVFGHCSLVDPEGYVYFIGGFDGTDYTGEVVRFDLEAQSWQLMPYKLRVKFKDGIQKYNLLSRTFPFRSPDLTTPAFW